MVQQMTVCGTERERERERVRGWKSSRIVCRVADRGRREDRQSALLGSSPACLSL